MNKRFTYNEELDIICRYEAGESSNSISPIYNTSPSVIMNVLRRNGIKTRDRKTSQKTLLGQDDIRTIVNMYRAGWTAGQLAMYFKTREKRIRKYLEKRGVKKLQSKQCTSGVFSELTEQ